MRIGLLFLLVCSVLAPFAAAKLVDYCEMKPRAARWAKIAIALVCLLFVIDIVSRLLGHPLFGH